MVSGLKLKSDSKSYAFNPWGSSEPDEAVGNNGEPAASLIPSSLLEVETSAEADDNEWGGLWWGLGPGPAGSPDERPEEAVLGQCCEDSYGGWGTSGPGEGSGQG